MSDGAWNPWKMTAIGMALVMVTALATGLVVANWSTREEARSPRGAGSTPIQRVATVPAAEVDACNRYAKSVSSNTPTDVLKDALVAGAIGAGVGAAGGAIAGGGKGAGKGAAIGGVVGATAGTLYGLNESNRNDARYVEAYRACMKGRGYLG